MRRSLTNKIRLLAAASLILIVVVSAITVILLQQRTTETTINVTPERSQFITEYSTGSTTSAPNAIAVDANGDVWFALQNQTSLGEFIPSNDTTHVFQLPEPRSEGIVTWGIAIDNSKGLAWFTDQTANAVWSFNVNTHIFHEYHLKTPNAFPFDLVLDQNGNVWFTELFGNKIGEVTALGKLYEIAIPSTGDPEPSGIATQGSNVWFALPGIESVASYSSGNFKFYDLSQLIDCPQDTCPVAITADPQGNLWMTFHGPNLISEFNPTSHYFRTISTSVPALGTSLPYFIETTQEGDVWFNEHYGNAMALFEPMNNTLVEYETPTRLEFAGNISGMLTMGLSDSGTPWFTEFFSGKIGTVNTTVPLSANLDVLNYSTISETPITIANHSQISLKLSIHNFSSSSLTLEGASGNLTGNFSFSFAPDSISGSAASIATIHNNGSKPGVYFLTLSAKTSNLIVSKIVEITVP